MAHEFVSDALTAVMRAPLTESDAKRSICNGIADQEIKIQLGLRRHATRNMTAHGKRLSGADVEIPVRLEPQDLDFEQSRPLRSWVVAREKIPALAGHWYIDWLELHNADLTKLINVASLNEKLSEKGPGGSPRPRRKTQTGREGARRAIAALFHNNLPDQVTEPNVLFCKHVGAKIKELGLPNVSNDTILRAAGRRK